MDLTTLSRDDLNQLRIDVEAEQRRRDVITNTETEQKTKAEQYAEAVKDEPPLTSIPATGVGPGRKYKAADGKVYINISGTFLPVGPDLYPLGYKLATAPGAAATWKAGEAVKAGDLRSEAGKVYKCLQPHTTQLGWEPSRATSLWALA